MSGDTRSEAQRREHYEVERELAARLRAAPREERLRLYAALYDELYRRVPHHPQRATPSSAAETARAVRREIAVLRPFLSPTSTFLELGPGACALSLAVSPLVARVWAVDVTDALVPPPPHPPGFAFVRSDGCSVPVPPGSVNVAYSHQVLEHLHPEDALAQLVSTRDALAAGGVYLCVTPNRLSGPHDVSRGFDPVATGFHLKEYTAAELRALLLAAGFARVEAFVGARGRFVRLPVAAVVPCERALQTIPTAFARPLARSAPFRALLGLRLVAFR